MSSSFFSLSHLNPFCLSYFVGTCSYDVLIKWKSFPMSSVKFVLFYKKRERKSQRLAKDKHTMRLRVINIRAACTNLLFLKYFLLVTFKNVSATLPSVHRTYATHLGRKCTDTVGVLKPEQKQKKIRCVNKRLNTCVVIKSGGFSLLLYATAQQTFL